MEGIVTLLREAKAAGLSVHLDGEMLVVRGPRSAERLAFRLLAHKSDVVAALRGPVCQRHPRAGVVDVLIHHGQSTRRDCIACGRFIMFTRWYENRSLN